MGVEGNGRIGDKAGDDILRGDRGDDLICGDDGNDIITSGSGNDTLVDIKIVTGESCSLEEGPVQQLS